MSEPNPPAEASALVSSPHPDASEKMAEQLARRIESLIMERGWPQGESLGSEQELLERFGVSRAVLREAVRIVEHHGAARMRRGPRGGLVATAPDIEAVQLPTALYLHWADVSMPDLYSARSALELTSVEIAAHSLDGDGIAALRELSEREARATPDELGGLLSHELHVLIARLSGNPALELFVETLANLTFSGSPHRFVESEVTGLRRAHRGIAEAIIAGDGALAQHRMRAHLAAALTFYQQRAATSTR